MWFQEDGAIHLPHSKRKKQNFLKSKFAEWATLRIGPVDWSPFSCNLKTLHYFLWVHMKSLVYTNKPAMIEELKLNILCEIVAISVNLC